MPAAPRSTIVLSPTLKAIRDNGCATTFSGRLDAIATRYQAIIAELAPKLTVEDWRMLLPILASTSFQQPGDAYLLPVRLKATGSALAYKLEAMKLPELIALIEAGQALINTHPEPSDDQIREHLKARA
jgi:hypothetical protein